MLNNMNAVDNNISEWEALTSARIREAFELFDKDKTEAVVQEEVGTIMRYLGAYPTERQLVLDILPAMQNDEPTGFVNYSRFEKKMLDILRGKTLEPDSSDVLLQAFKVLDSEGNGYLSCEVMEHLLTTKGTAFRPKELDQFMVVAKDSSNGNVYYEDYIALLTKHM
jgi:Ca2+-binding EF-hand superfamily protein